ncbi:hypothetical protein Y032_0303g1894 [Ancylostoma ceylanicum]|uniref:CCHC-type domain-containing protein n=1 Tax=Ancylostoma ceylanicum TaxID=53326 RepID=A0A016S4A7_9BILA|nr:hypothetical protein Y032_0303g1894 [Ancylostoma ceylanicum]
MQDECENCTYTSEKKEIMTEMQKIVKESQLHATTAEADDLIVILTAKLDESEKIRENMKIRLEYPKPKAQKVGAPTKNDPKIVRSSVDIAEQERQYVSLPSVSQTSLSSQNRVDPVALLEKEIAAKANVANGSLQKKNGKVMQSKQQHANYRHSYGKGCIFCQKRNHSSIQCRMVSNQHTRRKTLKEQNRCWKCFSPNHNSFICRKQDCSSCGQKHHSSLCLKKELLQVNYGKERRAITMALNSPNSRDWRNRDQRANNIRRSRTKSSSLTVQMCAETEPDSNHCTVKTTNRQTVLMTAEGSIWNAKRQQFEKVLICFDSGAQKTVVEEELAEEFGLPKGRIQMCTVSENGGNTETFKRHPVSLKIVTAFGEDIETIAETRPVITNAFPSVRLDQNDAAFLKANEIYLANTRIRGEHQIPRILVGLDYYNDLVIGHITRTPSGLHIAKTVFGPAIYGSELTEVKQIETVNYNLTAVWENTENHVPQKGLQPDGLIGRQRCKNFSKRSGEIIHAYGFTTFSLPLKENATEVAKNHSVAVRRLRCPQPQPSAVNSRRRRPALHVKPPFMPSSRRSPSTPALCRRPPRPQAVIRRQPRQEVDIRRTTTRKKVKPSDLIVGYDYSCRSPEYHRRIDDPHRILNHYPYRTSCGGGGVDPSYVCYDTY